MIRIALLVCVRAMTHVTLLVTTVSSAGTLLGAVTLSVSLVATVVALHRGSLNTVVAAKRMMLVSYGSHIHT